MPRALTEDERRDVKTRLLQVGKQLFVRYGLKKTTIGELVSHANIGKGTFYLFFDSKEDLFLSIEENEEALIKARLFTEVEPLVGDPRALLTRYFHFQFETMLNHPFLSQLSEPNTMAQLQLKLPQSRFEAHQQEDIEDIARLRQWLAESGVNLRQSSEVLMALSSAIFVLCQGRQVIGEGAFQQVQNLFVRSLVNELIGELHDD